VILETCCHLQRRGVPKLYTTILCTADYFGTVFRAGDAVHVGSVTSLFGAKQGILGWFANDKGDIQQAANNMRTHQGRRRSSGSRIGQQIHIFIGCGTCDGEIVV